MNTNHPLHFRPYAPADTAAMHNILIAAAQADSVDHHSTLESIPTLEEFAQSIESRAATNSDTILVATDETTGNIVGYGTIRWWREGDGTFVFVHQGEVHPDRRRKGVGSSLLDQLQQRIRQIAASAPEMQGAPKVFGSNFSETQIGARQLLERDGYTPFWSMVEMEFTNFPDLPETQIPEGYELRPVQSNEDKRAVYDANKAVYAGTPGSTPANDEDFTEFLEDNPDTSLWKVLWNTHDNRVAAFVISRKMHEGQAEIMEVSTVPDYRRQGLASLLMNLSMRELHEQHGIDIIRLHTGAEGKLGGRPLYKSLGFQALKEHHRLRKSL